MIPTIFWSVMVASALLALASLAWVTAEKNGLRSTDILVVIVPFVLWFLLLLLWHRPKSLSNLIEPFALVPVVGMCLAVRAFAFGKRSHTIRSSAALAVCIVATVALYAFVPVLPE
jgi:hypothetical protein